MTDTSLPVLRFEGSFFACFRFLKGCGLKPWSDGWRGKGQRGCLIRKGGETWHAAAWPDKV